MAFLLRRNTDGSSITWTADILQDTHDAFTALYPARGSYSSIIVLGLRLFLDALEKEPLLQVWAHNAIGYHLHIEEYAGKKYSLEVVVPTSLYTRFNLLLPEYGATSWFIRNLVAATVAGDTTPLQEQVVDAVNRFLAPSRTAA